MAVETGDRVEMVRCQAKGLEQDLPVAMIQGNKNKHFKTHFGPQFP